MKVDGMIPPWRYDAAAVWHALQAAACSILSLPRMSR